MEADWDLHAVVRGCSSSALAVASFHCLRQDQAQSCCVTPPGSRVLMDEEIPLLDCQPPFELARRSAFEELHELYKPFFLKQQPVCWQNLPPPSSPSSSSLASSLFDRTKSNPSSLAHLQTPSAALRPGSQTSKSKKRKNTRKEVCEVPAESVSSDVWAWRKYGQKPIKGSPFPRSYYRCSSSKGCLARKQVERNRSDPSMFIVTYTAEHNHPAPTHRNSLAGITRQKQPSPTLTPLSEMTNSDSNVQATSCSSPNSSQEEEEEAGLHGGDSPADEKEESGQGNEVEDECAGFTDMFPSEDFFAGLEGLMGGGSGDKGEEDGWGPCQTCFSFPWTANNTAAAAAAGGGADFLRGVVGRGGSQLSVCTVTKTRS